MSQLNLVAVIVRRSNGDDVVTKVVVAGGEHARAAVAREDLLLNATTDKPKAGQSRPSRRQFVELRPTSCYASSVCRGYCHSKKK